MLFRSGTLESSNQDIRELLKQGLDEVMKHQADTYDEMTKYGWYQIKTIEATTIKQTLISLQSKS